MIIMKRKAMMWSTVGRWIFVLAILLVLLILIGIFSGVLNDSWLNVADWLRFGG